MSICRCGAYCSGDFCKVCSTYLREPKARTKAIKKRSEKGEKEDIVYRALRLKFLRENPYCKLYPDKKATTVHHSRGRGKYYLDVKTWIPLSFEAHVYIETHPEFAYENGFSLSRLAKEERE